MLSALRNIILTFLVTGAAGAAFKFLYIDRLSPEQRAMWQARIDAAKVSGREAAAARRQELEKRLETLVGDTVETEKL